MAESKGEAKIYTYDNHVVIMFPMAVSKERVMEAKKILRFGKDWGFDYDQDKVDMYDRDRKATSNSLLQRAKKLAEFVGYTWKVVPPPRAVR